MGEEEKREKRKRRGEDWGIEIDGNFEKIEDLKTRDIYTILIDKRMKKDKEPTTTTNKALAEEHTFNELTTREKMYWFKLAQTFENTSGYGTNTVKHTQTNARCVRLKLKRGNTMITN